MAMSLNTESTMNPETALKLDSDIKIDDLDKKIDALKNQIALLEEQQKSLFAQHCDKSHSIANEAIELLKNTILQDIKKDQDSLIKTLNTIIAKNEDVESELQRITSGNNNYFISKILDDLEDRFQKKVSTNNPSEITNKYYKISVIPALKEQKEYGLSFYRLLSVVHDIILNNKDIFAKQLFILYNARHYNQEDSIEKKRCAKTLKDGSFNMFISDECRQFISTICSLCIEEILQQKETLKQKFIQDLGGITEDGVEYFFSQITECQKISYHIQVCIINEFYEKDNELFAHTRKKSFEILQEEVSPDIVVCRNLYTQCEDLSSQLHEMDEQLEKMKKKAQIIRDSSKSDDVQLF